MANKINANTLILNHFSQRYKPIGYVSEKKATKSEDGEEEESNVQKLLDEAKVDFNGNIIASYDFFCHKF